MLYNKIKEILKEEKYLDYGLRKDNKHYSLGDVCENSHELFQDAMYDLEGNLIYPYIEEGLYQGFYDAGELDGTCAIEVTLDNIEDALEKTNNYGGNYLHLIASDYAGCGNDMGEIIMENAVVLASL